MPHETNGINNAVSCYKAAVQFSASFVMSPFASFEENCEMIINFTDFSSGETLIKTADT